MTRDSRPATRDSFCGVGWAAASGVIVWGIYAVILLASSYSDPYAYGY